MSNPKLNYNSTWHKNGFAYLAAQTQWQQFWIINYPILTKLWVSVTCYNCYGDICLGNICPGKNCQGDIFPTLINTLILQLIMNKISCFVYWTIFKFHRALVSHWQRQVLSWNNIILGNFVWPKSVQDLELYLPPNHFWYYKILFDINIQPIFPFFWHGKGFQLQWYFCPQLFFMYIKFFSTLSKAFSF